MTTKQAAPATPLPWQDGTFKSGAVRGVVSTNYGKFEVPHPSDAAYIVEACNAFPRLMAEREQLVAALRQCVDAMADALDGGEYWQENFAKADIPQARALLARLGAE